jgi:hypothetical protein
MYSIHESQVFLANYQRELENRRLQHDAHVQAREDSISEGFEDSIDLDFNFTQS